MEVKTIMEEIQRLPPSKRFWVIEQTLKSIKKEEIQQQTTNFQNKKDSSFFDFSVSEKSLAKDWLSTEDNRWDKLL